MNKADEINERHIDIFMSREPMIIPPKETLLEWEKRKNLFKEPIPTLENTSFYVKVFDDQFFYCGSQCIKVSEHFSKDGRHLKSFIDDVVRYSSKSKNES